MAKEVTNKEHQEAVAQAVSKTDEFFKKYEKVILGVAAAAVVIAFGIYAYQKWVYQPKVAEAQEQLFPAEMAFAAEQWETALNGDGNSLGLAEVISQYKGACPKAAWFEAGVCALRLGNYDEALDFLKKYNGKDAILKARAIACQGDALVGLEKLDAALKAYEKAAAVVDNDFAAAYLLKAGIVAEELGKTEKALEFYKSIKESYPRSYEAVEIEKYITRISK
ncbi:MAG: tetratricopeptide repeat protein [Bacteroidales bacterium]|nr:tetratricopeptide repeat protein [Bacteroidales bacterium]